MGESLLSVGIDVGTSTTQLIVSRLTVENQAAAYSVPRLEIGGRELLYESPVHFTPLLSSTVLDAAGIRGIVEKEYTRAGLRREEVSTGAIIITGETARKENAREVLEALREFAGQFVVATAGPDLESVLAAKGSGAAAFSKSTGETLLHLDIGGGTSNLALIEGGQITKTACLNVGGRLIRTERGVITYVSPVLQSLCGLRPGDRAGEEELAPVIRILTEALERGCGLAPGEIPGSLVTNRLMELPAGKLRISFSGGVAELLEKDTEEPFPYGDIGVLLARSIRQSRLCRGDYWIGEQTLRATVIGAGCYSVQLSGSTVYARQMELPVQNLPVAPLEKPQQELPAEGLRDFIRGLRDRWEEGFALYLPGITNPRFAQVEELAEKLAPLMETLPQPRVLLLGTDMAKALGQALATRIKGGFLCLDGLRLPGESYLDVGRAVAGGTAYPVIIKTLVLG